MNAKKNPANPKEVKKRRKKEQRTDGTNSKMLELNPLISITTLNVNGVNTPVKSTNCQTG